MKKQPLLLPFLLAVSAALLSTVFLPHLRLFVFAPFLALALLRRPLLPSLWIALGSGAMMDLLSSDARFGLYALNFFCTTLIIFRVRSHFFETNPLSLSLFSSLIAALSTALHILILIAFGAHLKLTLISLFADLFLMPLVDGLYAFFWFTLPLFLYNRLSEKRTKKRPRYT